MARALAIQWSKLHKVLPARWLPEIDRVGRGRAAVSFWRRGVLPVRGRCQSSANLSMRGAPRPLTRDDKGAPLRQCGRASLLVNLPGDEMPLLLVVDLGVN
jgi:hypothetical protein